MPHIFQGMVYPKGMMCMVTDWTWCVTVNNGRMAVLQTLGGGGGGGGGGGVAVHISLNSAQ